MVSYVPKKFHDQIKADAWLKDVLKLMGAPDDAFVSGNAHTARASIKTDKDKGLYPLKMKDASIGLSIDYLKKKGLFPDKDDDEDDEMVFGDDDFPGGDDEEEADEVAEEEEKEEEEAPDDDEGGNEDPHDPIPESLSSNKNFEKRNKKVSKEGGKRGVEIEGAADMGGLQFFCTSVDEPAGEVDWLYESLRAMNEKSDPSEEERK